MAPSLTAVRPGLLLALAVLYTHATALALAAILKKMPGSQGSPECRHCLHLPPRATNPSLDLRRCSLQLRSRLSSQGLKATPISYSRALTKIDLISMIPRQGSGRNKNWGRTIFFRWIICRLNKQDPSLAIENVFEALKGPHIWVDWTKAT